MSSITPRIYQISPKIKQFLLSNKPIQSVHSLFKSEGYKIRIAGGWVRDACVLNKEVNDIDLATDATPEQMLSMMEKHNIRTFNNNGILHGTVSCLIENENIEITTLRSDVTTDGRHAEVKFHKNWQMDAERRDLTIGAMFLDLDDFTVIDYYNGYEDCLNGKCVFVGSAERRITEDYLRILRYFRFLGRMNENLAKTPEIFMAKKDLETLNTIKNLKNGLNNIANERKWVEISKMITDKHGLAHQLFHLMLNDCQLKDGIGLKILKNQDEIDDYLLNFEKMYLKQNRIINIINDVLKGENEEQNCYKITPAIPFLCPLVTEDKILQASKFMKMSNAHRDDALYAIKYQNLLDEFLNVDCPDQLQKNLQKLCFRFNRLVPNIKQRLIYMVLCHQSLKKNTASIAATDSGDNLLENPEIIRNIFSKSYEIAKLPVNGTDLTQHLKITNPKEKRFLQPIIQKLSDNYEESFFTIGKEELLMKSVSYYEEFKNLPDRKDRKKAKNN